MADKTTTVNIFTETYDELQLIIRYMKDESGFSVTNPAALRKVVRAYIETHPEVKGE